MSTGIYGCTINTACFVPGCCAQLHNERTSKCTTCFYTLSLKNEFNTFLRDRTSKYSDGTFWTTLNNVSQNTCVFNKFNAVFAFTTLMHEHATGNKRR